MLTMQRREKRVEIILKFYTNNVIALMRIIKIIYRFMIGALTDFPAYYSTGYSPDLIGSDDHYGKLVQQPLIEMIKTDYEEAFSKNIEDSILNLIKGSQLVSVDSKLNRYSEMKNSENQITVLGESIGLIIMLQQLIIMAW